MPLGDPQYQINALMKRIEVLETQAKASPAKAVPYAPLTAATSSGGTVVGTGLSQDAVSRAAQTAIQGALSGVEALQSVQTQLTSFDLSVSTTYTIRTEFLRPYPVVGQVYRATIAGEVTRGADVAFFLTLSVDITGGTSVPILVFGTAAGTSTVFVTQVIMVVTVAGTSAQIQVTGLTNYGQVGGSPAAGSNVNITNPLSSPMSGNLAPGSIDFTISSTALSAGASFLVTCYILESLGFRTG